MIRYRRYAVMAALIVCAAVTALTAALAQNWPSRPIHAFSPVQRRQRDRHHSARGVRSAFR